MTEPNIESLISADFASAAEAVLQFLYQRLGFRLWMVTKTEGNDWIVLQVKDEGYGVTEGSVFRWTDSFCSRMVGGLGPRVAPSSQEVPAYAAAPIGELVPIGAYVGVPLLRSDGSLFGTLCAIDPVQQPKSIVADLALVELLAKLLSTLLDKEMKLAQKIRETERIQYKIFNDFTTGLYNRVAWENFLATEEKRCRVYGCMNSIISVAISDPQKTKDSDLLIDDHLMITAAQQLKITLRKQDVIARVAEDKFAILAIDCDRLSLKAMVDRLSQCFKEAEIEASLGYALRHPSSNLKETWKKAYYAMYSVKKDVQSKP